MARRKVSVGTNGWVILAALLGAWTIASAVYCAWSPDRQSHSGLGAVDAAWAANAWETGQYRDGTPQIQSSPASPGTRSLTPTVRLSHTVVQRPRVRPGEVAALRAEYEVTAPPEGTLEVREIRIIRFEGQQLAKVERRVARATGAAASDYNLQVPPDAAPGWYTVTTILEPAVSTRAARDEQKASSAFYVQEGSTPPASTQRPDEDRIRMKLWAEKSRYKVGEAVRVFFEANKDAYVTLVNVGTSGRITILYPNKFSPSNEVKAGKTYSVPGAGEQYDLVLSGPTGVELVYALGTSTPTQFAEANFAREAFPTVNDKADVLTRDINVAVKKIPLKEQASALVEIEVTR
jgi:hypothetical protein